MPDTQTRGPVLHALDLMVLVPLSPLDVRVEVVLAPSGVRTYWTRIPGTEWFEQTIVFIPFPS